MKTYTHPTITLPAGSVVVKFFDTSKNGTVTTPDFIISIGDVEEGSDNNLGDLISPECEFEFKNINNYLFGTLFDTNSLQVLVLVDNELYFCGDFIFSTISPVNKNDPSSDLHFSKYRISAIGFLTKLNDVTPAQFLGVINAGFNNYFDDYSNGKRYYYLSAYLRGVLYSLSPSLLKNDTEDTMLFSLARIFKTAFVGDDAFVKDIAIAAENFSYPYPLNLFIDRLGDGYSILGELCREFSFYPYLIYDGDVRIKIREKDKSRFVTPGTITDRQRIYGNYLVNRVKVDLDTHPEESGSLNLRYDSGTSQIPWGEPFELMMHFTNIYSSWGDWTTSVKFYLKHVAGGHNYAYGVNAINNVGDVTDYQSFQAAIFYHYSGLYKNIKDWFNYSVKGLRATYSGSTKIEYLQPGYNFTDNAINYHIHSVKKSLMKNKTDITCIKIAA